MVELRQDFEYQSIKDQVKELTANKLKLESDITNLGYERDDMLNTFNQFKTITTKQLEEKSTALALFKSEIKGFIEEAKTARYLQEEATKQTQKVTNENIDLRSEMDKLRQRIMLLRQNRNWNAQKLKQKFCKSCNREYLETENFNWSCKIHRGSWGGDIWWCCGKTSKSAIGNLTLIKSLKAASSRST